MADINGSKLDMDDIEQVTGGVWRSYPGRDDGLLYTSSDTEEMIKREQQKARRNTPANIGIMRA